MLATDINELKTLLDIDPANRIEDKKLNFINEHVSNWIEELLNRKMTLQSRTEFYNGTGTQKLLLRSRPVFTTPAIQVWVDEQGYFGSTSGSFDSTTALTYGTDFALWLDQDDGTSRSGILIRIDDNWPQPSMRQRGLLSPFIGEGFGTIKVMYTAGYTLDSFPALLRQAAVLLAARMRFILPLGLELNSDSYEERSISIVTSEKSKLLALVLPMILPFRNWKW